MIKSLSYLTPLSTWHFDKYYRKNKYYGGVLSRDTIPKKLKNKFYIINLDDQSGSGTHWVVLYNVKPYQIYFDSFGVWPPKELSHLKNLVFNEYRIQKLSSRNCGLYCIYAIDELLKGKQFIDILLDFSPTKYNFNESKIFKWGEQYKI